MLSSLEINLSKKRMAYKKYIERNGKIYGPYVYHSRRVNGKVVSEYRGPKAGNSEKKFLFKKIFFGALFLIVVALALIFLKNSFTGKLVLDFEQEDSNGSEGNIHLVFSGGELIPADTQIILENGGNSYQYSLSDFVEEEQIMGDYYVDGLDVVGEGIGFGLIGSVEEIVPVFFKLEIKDLETSGEEVEDDLEENVSEEVSEENLTRLEEETVVEEALENQNEELLEEPLEESVEGVLGEIEEELQEEVEEELVEEIEEKSEEEVLVETEKEIGGGLTMTGNVVRGIGGLFSNILTGNVVKENLIIQGDVSKGGEFKQNIFEGKVVEIVPGSVIAEEKELEESVLNLDVKGNQVVVTTEYSTVEEGFGEYYLGDEELEIVIPLYSLNISFVEGPITIRGVYGEIDVFFYEGEIQENVSIINETEIINGSLVNITGENASLNVTNGTIFNGTISLEINLSEDESLILMKKFGTTEVSTSVKKYRDKFLVELKIGQFSLKHYYSNSLTKENLKFEIEKDKIIWLKDLAREFGREEIISEDFVL